MLFDSNCVRLFEDMGRKNYSSPFNHQDIASYKSISGINIKPYEARTVIEMSDIYFNYYHNADMEQPLMTPEEKAIIKESKDKSVKASWVGN